MATLLTLNKEDLEDILNGMVDGVITINQLGRILTFNETAESMFGYKSEEVIGKNVSMLMPDPERSAHDTYLQNHLTTGVAHIIGIGRNVTALKKNAETFPMRLSVNEYPAKIDGERWFIGSCKDITLQKQQEEQLRRSMKMDAIGKLTSGVAHDYNNMLGVIMGYSEILAERAKDHPEFIEYINHITHAAERAAKLTKQLLSISRRRADSAEATLINDVLHNNEQILAKTLTSQIKLSIKPAKDLWITLIDSGSLEDALLNLSINAMHAMPEGGELKISTSNVQVGSLDAQVLNIPRGDYIKLTLLDSGCGMTDEIISRIFDPFYSTKGESGTGLGLSQVYNFVTQSKGAIKVYSELGHGTCFSIYLPRDLNKHFTSEAEYSSKINDDELNGTANILIVDDELALREVTEEILSSHGYNVFCSSSGKEALITLESEKIDLVLSDVIMPEMDGFELAHIIHYKYPDIKIQLCSGFENVKGKSVTNKDLSTNLLTKPFTAKQLLIKIKEIQND